MGRLRPTVRIGLALILFGILWLTGWKLWQASHIWLPLEMPISLSQGHIRTAQFKVNMPGSYLVRIFVQWTPDFDQAPCFIQSRCPGSTALPISWALSDGQRIVARDTGNTDNGYERDNGILRELGMLKVVKGEYFVDLDVSQEGRRFNAGAPSLVVVENGERCSYVEGHVAQCLQPVGGFFCHWRLTDHSCCGRTTTGKASPLRARLFLYAARSANAEDPLERILDRDTGSRPVTPQVVHVPPWTVSHHHSIGGVYIPSTLGGHTARGGELIPDRRGSDAFPFTIASVAKCSRHGTSSFDVMVTEAIAVMKEVVSTSPLTAQSMWLSSRSRISITC